MVDMASASASRLPPLSGGKSHRVTNFRQRTRDSRRMSFQEAAEDAWSVRAPPTTSPSRHEKRCQCAPIRCRFLMSLTVLKP